MLFNVELEEVPKTDRLKAGFFRLDWACGVPEFVLSISGDQSWGSDAVLEVGTSLSEAREEKPLVVEMLSSSCCERLSLISLTKEKPVEKGPGAEEVEGWEKRLLEAPRVGEEASSGEKWRWERLRGGRDNTYS